MRHTQKDSSMTITTLMPSSGIAGTEVIIAGGGFTGASEVKFGDVAATTITVVSDTEIRATVPEGATTGNVTVTNGTDTAKSPTPFTVSESESEPTTPPTPAPVPAPTITSVEPESAGNLAEVKIKGTNLNGATEVKFNGLLSPEFRVVSATEISAKVPTMATTGKVTVTTPGGTATSPSPFTVTPPTPLWKSKGGQIGLGLIFLALVLIVLSVVIWRKGDENARLRKEMATLKSVGATSADKATAKSSGATPETSSPAVTPPAPSPATNSPAVVAVTATQFEQLVREIGELKSKLATATNPVATPTPAPSATKVDGGTNTTASGQSPDQGMFRVSTSGSGPTAVSFGPVNLTVGDQALTVLSNTVQQALTNGLKNFRGASAPAMMAPNQVYVGDNARNVFIELDSSKKKATATQTSRPRQGQVSFPSPKVGVASAGGFVTAGPDRLREVLPYHEHDALLSIQEAGYGKLVRAAQRGY